MRKTLLLTALALPLLAFECGGDDEKPATGGFACSLEVRGAVSEDLWCVATAYDYAAMPQAASDMWVFLLVAYRGQPVPGGAQPEPAAEVGFYLVGPPTLNQPYGWSELASVVDSGSASRWAGSVQAGTAERTHEAMAPLFQGDAGTGEISARFTAIPPVDATGAALLGVHGTVEGTLPALDGASAPVTIRARF